MREREKERVREKGEVKQTDMYAGGDRGTKRHTTYSEA